MRSRFPFGLTIVCVVAFALLIGLGVWQVQRLQWKQGLIAQAEAVQALPPASLADVLVDGRVTEFRRVFVECPGLDTAPFVELQTIHDGQAGVRLVSACGLIKLQPGGDTGPDVVMVDRGFVADTVSARPPVSIAGGIVRIEGEMRDTPPPGPMAVAAEGTRFYARDTPAMARALGVTNRVAAQTLFATTSSNPDWTALQPSAPPAAFSNNHLGYALTWFGLALALIGFYIALLRRSLRRPIPLDDTEKSST